MHQLSLKNILKNPYAFLALLTLLLLYSLALFAPFFSPYLPSSQNLSKPYAPPSHISFHNYNLTTFPSSPNPNNPTTYSTKTSSPQKITLFSKGFPYKLLGLFNCNRHLFQLQSSNPDDRFYLLGSDHLGRDVFSRLLYGSRVSLSIGLIGISITTLIGFFVGSLSGYYGGKFDFLSMRFIELLIAIPGLYLLLALRSTLAPYFDSNQVYLLIIVIFSLLGWSTPARIIRNMTLSIRNLPYVLASECMGQSTLKILLKHILPNTFSYILIAATLGIPSYIIGEAALSFLGLGIQEPSSSWGLMLKDAQQIKIFMLNYWWILSPGALILITVLSFNTLGSHLRDLIDPKFKI